MDILENINNTVVPEMDWNTQKNISYTQLSAWSECPYKWKNMYINKLKSPPSIYFSFGTAMHETLQEYLNIMYNQSQMKADNFDTHTFFQEVFLRLYKEDSEKAGKNLVTKEQLIEFTNDGLEIIDFFIRYRQEHFHKHGWELVGIEMPVLIEPHEDYPNVMLMGKLDLVMFDKTTHRLVIWDIKTSTRGWTKWDKQNKIKTSQMVIYKKYFADQYNVPIENIDVRYFIVKRKIPDNPKYQIMKSRIQKFEPSSGKTTINKTVQNIREFIEDVFIKGTHSYNTDKEYTKTATVKACRWCPFLDTEHCDAGVKK
jgi:hypothetical protein|tara:strand:+ start:1685 stop:2623 length:939 start_codon:yes stop_codon:yes gene_type:complete